MKTKCLLCEAVTTNGSEFYDHLEDIHMMPIRRMRIGKLGQPIEETHLECMTRFIYNHLEYGSEKCWCPECVGGQTLAIVNELSSKYGTMYVKH